MYDFGRVDIDDLKELNISVTLDSLQDVKDPGMVNMLIKDLLIKSFSSAQVKALKRDLEEAKGNGKYEEVRFSPIKRGSRPGYLPLLNTCFNLLPLKIYVSRYLLSCLKLFPEFQEINGHNYFTTAEVIAINSDIVDDEHFLLEAEDKIYNICVSFE